MENEPATVSEAVSDAAQAAEAAANVVREQAAETVAAVVAGAAAEIDAAHEQTQELARSAMETELGRQVAETNRRISEWLDGEGRALRQTVERLTTEMADLRSQIASAATVAAVAITQTPAPSIPAPSEENLTEAATEITEILPEALAPAPSENTPAETPARRRKVFL